MTTSDLYSLFDKKVVKINNLYLTFENKKQLVVSSENDPIITSYWFIYRDGQFYLKTDVPIINGLKEFLIQVSLGENPLLFESQF